MKSKKFFGAVFGLIFGFVLLSPALEAQNSGGADYNIGTVYNSTSQAEVASVDVVNVISQAEVADINSMAQIANLRQRGVSVAFVDIQPSANIGSETIVQDAIAFPVSGLAPNTTYTWTPYVIINGDTLPACVPFTFTTGNCINTEIITEGAIYNGQLDIDPMTPDQFIAIVAVVGAVGYTLDIDTVNPPIENMFGFEVESDYTDFASVEILTGMLEYGTTYYWRINPVFKAANDMDSVVVSCQVYSFTTVNAPSKKPFKSEESNLKSEIKVYPNPTNGELRIESGSTINSIEVIDMVGKKQSVASAKNGILNISNLPIGNYFIRITTDTETVVEKIIKE